METRSKRKRVAVKVDNDFTELDSDEFEQMLEEDSAPSRKKSDSKTTTAGKKAKTSARAAAAAAAAAAAIDSDYEPEQDVSGLPAAAAAAPEPSTAQDSESSEYHSISDNDDAEPNEASDDEDYGSSKQTKTKQQQKTKKQQPKQKKPRKKRQSTRRLCLTYAKAQFKLTDKDLLELTDIEYRDNPHYALGPPMKLYLVRELEELAQRKADRKARDAEEKEERAAARALEARARRAAAAAAAAQKAAAFDSHTPKEERHGSVVLPDTCLARIMTCLAGSMDLAGLRGPSAVAKDLGAAALVCWDFYHAAKAGFEALGHAATEIYCQGKPAYIPMDVPAKMFELGKPSPTSLGGWQFWDCVVQQPMQLKLPQLKDAARYLGLQVTGTKAELMLRVLGAFNLSSPTTAPAELLRALVLERSPTKSMWMHWGGLDSASWYAKVANARNGLVWADREAGTAALEAITSGGAAGFREHLRAQGYSSLADWVTAAEETKRVYMAKQRQQLEEQRARQCEDAERQRAEAAQRRQQQAAAGVMGMQRQHVPHAGGLCRCGNAAAQACSRGCCGKCCKVDGRAPGAVRCIRHNT